MAALQYPPAAPPNAEDEPTLFSPLENPNPSLESNSIILGPPIAQSPSSASKPLTGQAPSVLSIPMPMTKPRTRTMSSTMSFSAIFPTSSSESQLQDSQSPHGQHTRYNSADTTTGPGSMSPDSARNGEIVGSPFSIMSEEDGFMLGTPTSPAVNIRSVGQHASGSHSAKSEEKGWGETWRRAKGKGRDLSGDGDDAVEPERGDPYDTGGDLSERGPAVSVTAEVVTDASLSNIRHFANATPVTSQRRPQPVHSFTYSATTSNIRPTEVAAYHSSGRSTPVVIESASSSSMQSKFSTMRVKMKRKGSSLMDVLGKGKDVDRIAGRSRSGTTSSVATSISAMLNDQSPSSLSAAEPSRNSSKVNLRTRLADRFDLSSRTTSDPRPLQFFRRNKSSTSAPTITVDSTVQARSSPRDNRTPVHTQVSSAGLDADGDAGQYDYFSPSPASAKHNPVRLASVAAVVLPPMSPISPFPAHTTSAMTPPDAIASELDVPKKPSSAVVREVVERRSPSRFDAKLPRELQLQCFATLLELHVAEHVRAIRKAQGHSGESKERAIRYLENRWVGKMAGRRELFKVSRVSRAWQDLAFDGQLWKNTDFHEAIGHLPPSSLIALLARNQGAYIRNLSLNGWRNIPPRAFAFAMTNNGGRSSRAVVTTLEKLDLQGCASLDSRTLEAIIENSPNLKWLSLRGNRRVTDDVVRAISFHADQLEYLDLSRCRSISLMADGGMDEENSWPALKTLKLCGGPVESGLLGLLASAAPILETLDISYSVDIDDEEIKEFVALPAEKYNQALALAKASANGFSPLGILADSVMLTPAQAGELESAFPCDGMVPRRVTKLRHLNLSNCPNITQKAAAYLAHAVPQLEILEMASVGEMTSDGLVALFDTTPSIRKVDLEGATQACDRILAALTPPSTGKVSKDAGPGRDLEVFAIGHASHITNDGALKLLRACPQLVQVNFEGTPVTDVIVKDFIRRKRGRTACLRVTDCRGVNRNAVEAYESHIRHRSGWRGYQAAPLEYHDPLEDKDDEGKLAECNNKPVVQSFWGWSKMPAETML